MKLKKTGLQVKDMNEEGHALIALADLDAVDHDMDTYDRGAFTKRGDQWATILPGHSWGAVPLGKARVYEQGNQALAELHLNLKTTQGREWYEAIKFDFNGCCDGAVAVQEYSYGFRVLDSAQDNRDGKTVRIIRDVDVFEVSPVVQGAGIGTGTLSIKDAKLTQDHFKRINDDLNEMALAIKANPEALSKAGLNQLKAIHDGLDGLLKASQMAFEKDCSVEESIAISNRFIASREVRGIKERLSKSAD